MFMTVACTSTKNENPTSTGSELREGDVEEMDSTLLLADWGETDLPMYLTPYEAQNRMVIHPFDNEKDSAYYAANGARYTTLIDNGKTYKMKFKEVHEGESIGNLIGGDYSKYMSGVLYDVVDTKKEYPGGFGFTDAFMASHQFLPFELFEEGTQAPDHIIKMAQQSYPGKVQQSWICAETTDKSVGVYRLQYQPVDTICMGMLLVVDGDKVYTELDPAYRFEDGSFTWHVDDDGIYGAIAVEGITRGEKGLDLFCVDYACESVTPFVCMARDGAIASYNLACYYVYIDFRPSAKPVSLSKGAKLAAELDGYKIWIDEEIAQSEDNPAGQYGVYYQGPDSKEYYYIASNSMGSESEKYIIQGEWPLYVSKYELLSCTDAYLTKSPSGDVYLILEGCPDCRNIFTYVTSLPIGDDENYFRWMHTNSGYQGLDESGELFGVANYSYNDEGRYTVVRYFNFNYDVVRESKLQE